PRPPLRGGRPRRDRHERGHDRPRRPGRGPGDGRAGAVQPGRAGHPARPRLGGDRLAGQGPEAGPRADAGAGRHPAPAPPRPRPGVARPHRLVVVARLLLASANQGKLRELRTILGGLGVELVGLAEAGLGEPPEVEETGETFLENALLKGRAYAAWSGLAAVADDSGLEVDALGGAPGVRSARYAGPGASDQANLDKLLAALAGIPPERRTARFPCAAVLVDPEAGKWEAEAAWEGRILDAPRGSNG